MTSGITDEFYWDSVFGGMLDGLTQKPKTTMGGLGGASLSLAIVSAHRLAGPTIVVAPTVTTAESIRDDIQSLTGSDVLYFPAYETLPFQGEEAHQSVIADRIECMAGLHSARPDTLVVVPARALVKRLPPSDSFKIFTIYRGMRLNPDELESWLLSAGYIKESSVFEQGRWSRRGGIIDVGTYGTDNPFRIEFFGDEVESVRLFDQHSQRSINRVGSARLLPAREIVLTPEEWNTAADLVPEGHPLEEHMYGSSTFPGIEHHLPLFFRERATIFDFLAEIGTLILVEPQRLNSVIMETIEARQTAFPDDLPFSFSQAFASWEEIKTRINRSKRILEHTLVPSESVDVYLPTEPQTGFMGHRDEMFRQLRLWRDNGFRIAVACDANAELSSFYNLLPEDLAAVVELDITSISDGFV
ncbi:MAG: hypothetical protein GY852_06015, partial [bacterium]|nr:hypothetical protein [bacterium]